MSNHEYLDNVSPSNKAVFDNLTEGQKNRILNAPIGTNVEGVNVDEKIKFELRQYQLSTAKRGWTPSEDLPMWPGLDEAYDKWTEENIDFKPNGIIELYIANDDEIHDDKFIDGIDVVGGMPKNLGLQVNGENANGGEPAQRYEARLILDPENEDFGKFDAKYGIKNTRLSSFFTGEWYSNLGGGTYGDEGDDGIGENIYQKLLNHDNMTLAIHNQLMQLDAYATETGLDKNELVEKLKANNEDIGERFEEIVSRNIDHNDFNLRKSNTYGRYTPEFLSDNFSDEDDYLNFYKESFDENFDIKKIKNINDSNDNNPLNKNYSEILTTFDSAPEQFKNSFSNSLTDAGIISLKYPHDAVYGTHDVAGQDHIVIEMFEYQGSQSHIFSKEGRDSTLNLTGLRRSSNIKRYIGAVRLPIPNNLSFSNGVSWGDGRINAVEAAAFMFANANIAKAVEGEFGDLAKNVRNNLGQFLNDIKGDKLSSTQPAGLLLSAFASQFALGRIGINVDANQFIQRGVGQSINPNLELLFNGPKLRSFTFSFNFAPNDELDGSMMRNIQRFFKQGMAPKRNNENLIFLGSPNVFRIRYRTKQRDRIKGLPIHKICALTTCEINYAPDNLYQSYEDTKAGSSPVRTIMNLNFTELTPIFENDYRSEVEQTEVPGSQSGLGVFSDEFGNKKGEGAFDSITQEDTGF
jgi:hypothetical protein